MALLFFERLFSVHPDMQLAVAHINNFKLKQERRVRLRIFLGGHAMKRVALATDRTGRKTVCIRQYLGTSSYAPHSFSTMLSAAHFF